MTAIAIRLATLEDAADILHIYAPMVCNTAISFETDPPDECEMKQRILKIVSTYPWLVCTMDERVIGYAYASPFHTRAAYRWSVETSIYIHPDFHRLGVGRGLYTSLFKILVAQGIVNAYAAITLPNPGSIRLHESMGFEVVGIYKAVGFKLGRWHDVGWWHLDLQPHKVPPEPPVVLRYIQQSSAWNALVEVGKPSIQLPK